MYSFKTWEAKFSGLRWVVVVIGVGLLINALADIRHRANDTAIATSVDEAVESMHSFAPDEAIDELNVKIDELQARMDELEAVGGGD